jgi:hypothetical protein
MMMGWIRVLICAGKAHSSSMFCCLAKWTERRDLGQNFLRTTATSSHRCVLAFVLSRFIANFHQIPTREMKSLDDLQQGSVELLFMSRYVHAADHSLSDSRTHGTSSHYKSLM